MKNDRKYILVIFSLILLAGCFPARRLADQNISSLYTIADNSPLPFYSLYQYSADSLRLYFSIPERTARNDEEETDTNIVYRFHVSLFSKDDRNTIYDSATYHVRRENFEEGSELKGSIDLFTGEPSGKTLSVVISNLENGTANEQLFTLTSAYPPGKYHYLLFDENQNPITSNHLSTAETFSIGSSIIRDQKIKVRYYSGSFPIAMPPFSILPLQYFNYTADSIFDISFRDGLTENLRFSRPGIYHITADTNSRVGYTIFIRDMPFPFITQATQMLEPLRYITSGKEFGTLVAASNPKDAVDQFWINNSGNEMRARKLIREYYRRVEKANYLFTSYHEGWKTDRGMIYIIYGPPTIVQRTETSEIWTYGESRHLLSLTFIFSKVNNPFTGNDYMLERQTNYKTGWYQMVNSWRR